MSSRKTTTAVFRTSAEPIKLAPRKQPKLTPEEKSAQHAFVEAQMEEDRIARLTAELKAAKAEKKAEADKAKEERKAHAAERKAEKAAKAATRLEDENAKQSAPARWHYHVTGMVTRRMQAGQSQDEAIEAALAALRGIMVAKLAEQPTADEATTDEE
jgi:hypothetical protein